MLTKLLINSSKINKKFLYNRLTNLKSFKDFFQKKICQFFL